MENDKTKSEQLENEKPAITLKESRENPGMAYFEGELLTRGQAFEKLGDKYRIMWILQ
jgi:uncharacterized protein YcbX